jgi:hypothetical protein
VIERLGHRSTTTQSLVYLRVADGGIATAAIAAAFNRPDRTLERAAGPNHHSCSSIKKAELCSLGDCTRGRLVACSRLLRAVERVI